MHSHYQQFPLPTTTWRRRHDGVLELAHFNSAALEVMEHCLGELVGRSASELYPPGTPLHDVFARCEIGFGTFSVEKDYRLQGTGAQKRLEITAVELEPTLVNVHARDITEHYRAQQVLRHHEARLRQAHRVGRLGTWELNVATGELRWSSDCAKNTGLPQGLFTSTFHHYLGFVHPDDRGGVAGRREPEDTTGDDKSREVFYRLILPNGSIRHVVDHYERDPNDDYPMLLGTIQDVTNQHQETSRLRVILDELYPFIGMFELDGTLVEVNRASLRESGPARRAILGKPFWETHWWSYSEDVQSEIRSVLRKAVDGQATRRDFRARIGDEKFRILDTMVAPIRDHTGSVRRIIASAVDVTERRHVEEALKASLAEKELLLREVHHRLKNNLQIVSSMLQMQERRTREPDIRTDLKWAQGRIRALALIHSSLHQGNSLAVVAMTRYLHALSSSIQSLHGTALISELDLEVDAVELELDRAIPCGLIAHELLTNAARHAYRDEPGPVAVVMHQRDDVVYLSVRDSGVGMCSPRETALGLELCQLLAKQLRGSLKIESEQERGTAITLQFPASVA